MLCELKPYKDGAIECWLLVDSEMGEIETGWATYRSEAFVIIDTYQSWGKDPLPNLRVYYEKRALSVRKSIQILYDDYQYLIANYTYRAVQFEKYYPCIKNYLEKLSYVGRN